MCKSVKNPAFNLFLLQTLLNVYRVFIYIFKGRLDVFVTFAFVFNKIKGGKNE